ARHARRHPSLVSPGRCTVTERTGGRLLHLRPVLVPVRQDRMTSDGPGLPAGRSGSGIPLLPFYRPEPGARDYVGIGDPGTYPFTRGRLRPPGARPRGWIQRELSGEGSPRRSNEQLRALLAHGALGVDVIGDNPTVSALDPDHP